MILWMRNILLCLCTSSFYPFIHSHTLVSSHPLSTVNHVVINMRVLVHLLHAEHLFRVLQFLDHHVIYNGNTISCLHRLHELMILSPYHFFLLLFSYSSFTGVRCCLIINLFTSFQLLEEWKMVINIMNVYNICFLDVSIFCLF